MTIQEISEYLGLNEFTTYRLVKNGKIPAKKKENGKWQIEKTNIDGLFESAMKTVKNRN
jgi:excisionase family DNA binding protein